jgi:hypothetical protein
MNKENAKFLGLVTLVAMMGCVAQVKPTIPAGPPPSYSLTEIISKAKDNTANLDRFRAKGGRLSGEFPTDKGKTRHYDLDGVAIRYEGPRNLYLSGNMLGSPALLIGSNKEKYWLGVMNDPSRLNWGYWKFADHEANPWRMGGPVKLMEALGQIKFRNEGGEGEGKALAGPALHRQDDANVLLYFSPDEIGNWYIAKEIYLSRHDPILVNKIIYYKPDGNQELVVVFSDHAQVPGGGTMAYTVEMTWPAEKGSMKLSLGKVTLGETHPEGAFSMPDVSTFHDVEQVDANCK